MRSLDQMDTEWTTPARERPIRLESIERVIAGRPVTLVVPGRRITNEAWARELADVGTIDGAPSWACGVSRRLDAGWNSGQRLHTWSLLWSSDL
jgi:hypothetical protein